VWLRKGEWLSKAILDGESVSGINSHLSAIGEVAGRAYGLIENDDKCFVGSIILGTGFILDSSERTRLIEKNRANEEVIFPYLGGEDVNSFPDQISTKWIINFEGAPLDRISATSTSDFRVASQYPDCLAIVEARVKPDRDRYDPKNSWNKKARTQWWLYGQWRWALAAAVKGEARVLVRARIANLHSVVWVPVGSVFNDKVVVFVDCAFSILQSDIHEAWARYYSSTLRTDMQYTPSACFSTFPFVSEDEACCRIGAEYHECRRKIMLARQEGLTKTYNRFHDPDETSDDLQKLRQLHIELDHAVAVAYGWTDLDLGHGFHQTKQGLRYTISEAARREVLGRLLKLNHERYAEEVRQGLHEKKARKTRTTGKRNADAPGLFG
jgi:hypothetical protein